MLEAIEWGYAWIWSCWSLLWFSTFLAVSVRLEVAASRYCWIGVSLKLLG